MQPTLPDRVPVLIAGGGPVGLMLAALLGRYGVRTLLVEADESYCVGSRAICISRRSLEIIGWVGADRAVMTKGLPWVSGRSHFRDQEVLHFRMPHDETERFAPMVNIQQYYIEQYAHEAALASDGLADVRWGTRVTAVHPVDDGAHVELQTLDGPRSAMHADWVVACDGARSTVRDSLGLRLQGDQYEGRYVIVDIRQKSARAVERLAWFDPPSNPGSTVLMHRQPDDVWRLDYQVGDDEDSEEAVKPDNVFPRVQRHLEMIGELEPWEPLWTSTYSAKCLTLPSYRHGRVLFAGDAAHLIPIFGVRGLNSGLDDAGNVAWKLALVIQGRAADTLLDSYSTERVGAARENMAYGARSTEFMAPPHRGFRLFRDAALRLATEFDAARPLLNPRQTTPVEYVDSPLNTVADHPSTRLRAGMPAPDARLDSVAGDSHVTEWFGRGFVLLCYRTGGELPRELRRLARPYAHAPASLTVVCIVSAGHAATNVFVDRLGQFATRYGAEHGSVYLVRPDGYLAACWRAGDVAEIHAALATCGLEHDFPLTDQ